jgi:GTP-binding protein
MSGHSPSESEFILPLPPPLAERKRVVAVVGRPNVGKSALFNRITGRRIAIVHDESGVTRDRIVRQVQWEPAPFDLVDTGGVRVVRGANVTDAIEAGVIAQVEAALDDAAAAILVVDAQTGLHPIDAEVAQLVRRAGVPCCIAVNKCDLPQHEAIVPDFASLGFAPYPVSALHDRGLEALMADVTSHLPATVTPQLERPLRVAVVGRPNAGKSSYINRLLRNPRVIVSEVAGTTRDSIEIPFSIGSGPQARHYLLIDTAGMRHVHRIDNAVERFSLFRAEQSISDADVVVLIMDAQSGPTVQDKHIAAFIQKERKGCVLIVNKWDIAMAQEMTQAHYEPALRSAMPFMKHCPVVFISAQSGYNVRRSVEVIDEVAGQLKQTLPTGMLNRTIADATERTNMPGSGDRKLRIYYATQTGTAPIEIRLYVNDVKLATDNFTDFLIRSLRERFGLVGAPVSIRYRERSRPEGVEARVTPKAPGRFSTAKPRQPHAMRTGLPGKTARPRPKASGAPKRRGKAPGKFD